MARYRTKMIDIEAIHLFDETPDAIFDVVNFVEIDTPVLPDIICTTDNKSVITGATIKAKYGDIKMKIDDWLVRDKNGKLYVYSNELFVLAFERGHNSNRYIPF